MRINCRGEGCQASIEIGDSAHPFSAYTCKIHVGKTAVDKVRFQEVQFDPNMGSGTDPRAYERGFALHSGIPKNKKYETGDTSVESKQNPAFKYGKIKKTKLLEDSQKALEGHENKKEILEILNKDTRDGNSGISRKDE